MKIACGILLFGASLAIMCQANVIGKGHAGPNDGVNDNGMGLERGQLPNCAQGWLASNITMHCYLFEDNANLTWDESVVYCKRKGGRLVEVETKDEDNMLITEAKKRNYDYVWIGLTDQYIEGKWEWSCTPLGSYKNWHWSAPDNYHGREHCVAYRKIDNNQWQDIPCEYRNPVICEKPSQ